MITGEEASNGSRIADLMAAGALPDTVREIGAVVVGSLDQAQAVKPEDKLVTILKNHRATVFGEDHNGENLLEQYKQIFAAAEKAGIKDAMIEQPPRLQGDIDATVKLYSDGLKAGRLTKEEILSLIEPDASPARALSMLAAAHGVKLHAVDVGNRADTDIFREALGLMKEYQASHPNSNPEEFLKSLTKEQLTFFGEMAGRPVTKDDVGAIMERLADPKRFEHELYMRVMDGDKKIANLALEKAQGRPFIAIFGKDHGGLIHEERVLDSYEVDLEGALRLSLGEKRVAHIEIGKEATSMTDLPDYRLTNDFKIEDVAPGEAPIKPELLNERLEKHKLPNLRQR